MQLHRLLPVAVLLAASGLLTACSGSTIEGDPGQEPTIREAASVETTLSKSESEVGERVAITCTLLDADGEALEGSTRWDVTPFARSADGVSIAPDESGTYVVACSSADGALVDDTPATLEVLPDGPVAIRTRLPADEIPACFDATVGCVLYDRDGMAVPADGELTVVHVSPDGVDVDGHHIATGAPGQFTVTCATADGTLVDQEPPTLTVVEGIPARVVTRFVPNAAAPGQRVQVLCELEDACGTPVQGDTIITVGEGLLLDGSEAWAEAPGNYTATCHVAGESKYPVEEVSARLQVTQPPVRIRLWAEPDRELFGLNRTVRIRSRAYDAEDNVIPAEIEITTPEGIQEEGNGEYRFIEEGQFTWVGRLAAAPEVTDEVTLMCDAGAPQLFLESPERGATFGEGGVIPIRGYATDGAGIASVSVNGVDIPFAEDGTFAWDMPAHQGLNHLYVKAADHAGRAATEGRGPYYSDSWLPMPISSATEEEIASTRVLDSVALFLGQEALDDGDHDPAQIDDLATVIELLLSGIDLESLLLGGGLPMTLIEQEFPGIVDFGFTLIGIDFILEGDLTIRAALDDVIIGGFGVSAIYRDGGIDLSLGIVGDQPEDPGIGLVLGLQLGFDLRLGFNNPVNGNFIGVELDPPATVTTTTSAYAHGVGLELGIDADMPTGGELTVAVSNVGVYVEDIDVNLLEELTLDLGGVDLPVIGHVDLPEIPLTSLVQGLDNLIGDTIIDPAIEWIVNGLSDLVGPFIGDLLTPLMEQLVDVLALDLDLPIPSLLGGPEVNLHLSMRPSSVHMDPDGGTFGLAAGLTSAKAVDRDPLGSILRAGCLDTAAPDFAFDPATPMQAGLLFDFLNEAVFSIWWGGALNLGLDLGDLGGGGMGGISGDIALDFLLPPILTDCTPDGWLELQVGDLWLELDGSAMGFAGSMTAYVSATVGVQLVADGNTIGLTIGGEPSIELEIMETTGALDMFASMLPSLIEDTLIPMLVDGLSGGLGSIPIPEIPLDGIAPGVPPGSALRIGALRAETGEGYLLLGGALE